MPTTPRHWTNRNFIAFSLWPVAMLFGAISALRRWAYRNALVKRWSAPVAVVVVGNIAAGGTGKTPLLIALVELLKQRGLRVGVVSRGYKSQSHSSPYLLNEQSTAAQAGDEPILIATKTAVPVCVFGRRAKAVQALLRNFTLDVVLSDDGLQHYALDRDIEVAVVDAANRHGNGFLLPAGPLRESPARLSSVDFIAYNQSGVGSCAVNEHSPTAIQPAAQFMSVRSSNDQARSRAETRHAMSFDFSVAITGFTRLDSTQHCSLEAFKGVLCHAVAGIGRPRRFFEALESLGIPTIQHALPDHHAYRVADFHQWPEYPVLITEKDAAKCRDLKLNPENIWVAETSVTLPSAFEQAFMLQLSMIIDSRSRESGKEFYKESGMKNLG